MNKTAEIGSVSSGTMREADLIPVFLRELALYNSDAARSLNQLHVDLELCEEDLSRLLEELFDRLDECAPDGCYFGSHPGDGADYGFWPSEQETQS